MAGELKQALQNKKDEAPKTVKDLLASPAMLTQIQHALPKHMKADRMARVAMTLMRQVPDLQKCDPMSFMGALMQVSQLGLEPGGALGHAYLLPFKVKRKHGNEWREHMEVQVIIGYRGMIDLARRSGQIESLSARVVREKDAFSYGYGLDETLHHVPFEGVDAGDITHFYAVAKLKGGGVQFEVMTAAQVNVVRDNSQGYKAALASAEKYKGEIKSPWATNYDEMGRKTVVRRLFKYLPVSIEIQTAVGLDEQADAGVNQHNASLLEGDFHVLDNDPAEPMLAESPIPAVRAAMESADSSEVLDAAWNEFMAMPHNPEDETELGKLYAQLDKKLHR